MSRRSFTGRRSSPGLPIRRSSGIGMGVERLESRINPSATPLGPAIQPASDAGAGGGSLLLSPVAAPVSQQVSALTTSSAAVVAAFAAKNRLWSAAVDVVVPALPSATSLRLEVTGGLAYWNARQTPAFVPAGTNVRLDLTLGGRTVAVRGGQPQPKAVAALALAAPATNRIAAQLAVVGRAAPPPAAGWYRATARVVDATTGTAAPVTILFSLGGVPAGSRAAALRAVGGVGTKPAAVTVGVALAPPPVVAPVSAARGGLPAGFSAPPAPAAPQTPVVRSPPPFVLPPAVGGIVEVSRNITGNTTFSAGTVYVITGEVHVTSGVTLTIEDGVEVRIRNGHGRFSRLTSRALIFDSGSSLQAKNVVFQAADDSNQAVSKADNGGVFFCGGTRAATKDNVSSEVVGPKVNWGFTAESIVANYLGRRDPPGGDGDGHRRDDIDAVSLIGVITDEWKIDAVDSRHSGDDGFDLTDSKITMQSVRVIEAGEDGVNLSSSYLTITRSLVVDMTDSKTPRDREIFDFEVGPGPARITVSQDASVDIRGFWDNSPHDHTIWLRSRDMKPLESPTRFLYAWKGKLLQGPALIYSV